VGDRDAGGAALLWLSQRTDHRQRQEWRQEQIAADTRMSAATVSCYRNNGGSSSTASDRPNQLDETQVFASRLPCIRYS